LDYRAASAVTYEEIGDGECHQETGYDPGIYYHSARIALTAFHSVVEAPAV
jgi:hypothetical protein